MDKRVITSRDISPKRDYETRKVIKKAIKSWTNYSVAEGRLNYRQRGLALRCGAQSGWHFGHFFLLLPLTSQFSLFIFCS